MISDTQQPNERNSSATSTPPLTEELNTAFEFQNDQEQEDGKNSALTIKLPSLSDREFNNGGEGFVEDDEPRTPTSSDQKIPTTTACPPAPRKPKTVPMGNKRKTRCFQRISVDLSVIMNAMIAPVTVPDFLAGDLHAGDHSKKVKKANVTTGS